MDYFYKPPLQRQDEWTALEDNYINCLVQKSFSDFKNFQYSPNTCKMDSVSLKVNEYNNDFYLLIWQFKIVFSFSHYLWIKFIDCQAYSYPMARDIGLLDSLIRLKID